MHVCVLGSLNVDLVARVTHLPAPGETLLATELRRIPGGKGANQAVAAARLGAQVTMIGNTGNDELGAELRQSLAHDHVDVSRVGKVGEPTGIAMIAVDEHGENTIVVAAGANAALRPGDLAPATPLAVTIAEADVLLLQLEVRVETVYEAILRAREHGVRVVLNAAPAAPLRRALLDNVDVLIVNRGEAAALTGLPRDTEVLGLLHALSELGPDLVTLTIGAGGALSCDRGRVHVQEAFPVASVDQVAAGDAFSAALAVAIAEGKGPAKALELACAAGALATTKTGAQPSLPSRTEVEALVAAHHGESA